MKHSELIKELRRTGCKIARHGKRHDIWYSPVTQKEFPVPRHFTKDVPIGTLKAIKADAGLK